MYLSFFGLNEKPFAITPDPRYLFLSARHAEALAHLVYGIKEAGGFIQLLRDLEEELAHEEDVQRAAAEPGGHDERFPRCVDAPRHRVTAE